MIKENSDPKRPAIINHRVDTIPGEPQQYCIDLRRDTADALREKDPKLLRRCGSHVSPEDAQTIIMLITDLLNISPE